MLDRLKTVATVIVVAALAAVAFLLYDTSTNVREARDQMTRSAQLEIKEAVDQVRRDAENEIAKKVAAFLASTEFNDTLNTAVTAAVAASVQEAVDARAGEINARVTGALSEVNASVAEVSVLTETVEAAVADAEDAVTKAKAAKEEAEAALAESAAVRTAFESTRQQMVRDSQSVLPIQYVRDEGKADPGRIPEYLEQRINALSFQLGGYYDGPITWKYIDRLSTIPEFEYVVIFEDDGRTIFGLYGVSALKARFDPPNQAELSTEMGAGHWALPDESAVPGWTAFARMVRERERENLRALPSFQSGGEPVVTDWSSVDALRHMDRLRADTLPVVDAGGAESSSA
jgi:hypothetical protein